MNKVRQQEMKKGPEGPRASRAEQVEHLSPDVDIYETPTGLVLEANVPGIVKDSIDLKVDAKTLTLQAKVKPPASGSEVYQEFVLADYYRSFLLPEDVDAQKITADLDLGVLRIVLPKASAAQPRKIEVKTTAP